MLPLAYDDDEKAYDDLRRRVLNSAKPRDFLEELLLRDVVDESWEILRMRRVKGILLSEIKITPFLEKVFSTATARETILQVASKRDDDPKAAEEYNALWATITDSSNFTQKDLTVNNNSTALEIVKNIEHIERIDRLIASAATRRNNALHEIERHRVGLGAAIRLATAEIEEAEFTEVDKRETVLGSGNDDSPPSAGQSH